MNSTGTFLSVEEAANQLDFTSQYIRILIKNKKLSADRVGNSWIIPQTAIEAYEGSNQSSIIPDRKSKKNYTNGLVALSFFSGALGLDIGLEKEGIEVRLASEIDSATRKTIASNKPDIGLIGDINEYSAHEIRDAANISNDTKIDLIVGGPPCQAFSTAGKRSGFEDKRGNVFLTFIDRIIDLDPTYAVIENVRGLLSAPLLHVPHSERLSLNRKLSKQESKGGALDYILKKLKESGYSVSFNLYNAANFGSPQKRERVVLLCSKTEQKIPFLEPTHSEDSKYNLPPWNTVKNAFRGLDSIKHNHINFPEKRLRFYRLLKEGQYWKHLPIELQAEALGDAFHSGGGKTGFYRRIAWNQPSPTLVTNPTMPATDLCHPSIDRPLSIEEYKRIQEFPDDWKLEGTLIDQYRQVGNAVPISLGRAIGRWIINHMNSKPIKNYEGFQYSRYKDTDEITWRKEYDSRTANLESAQAIFDF